MFQKIHRHIHTHKHTHTNTHTHTHTHTHIGITLHHGLFQKLFSGKFGEVFFYFLIIIFFRQVWRSLACPRTWGAPREWIHFKTPLRREGGGRASVRPARDLFRVNIYTHIYMDICIYVHVYTYIYMDIYIYIGSCSGGCRTYAALLSLSLRLTW
jgi:hypothetical protein